MARSQCSYIWLQSAKRCDLRSANNTLLRAPICSTAALHPKGNGIEAAASNLVEEPIETCILRLILRCTFLQSGFLEGDSSTVMIIVQCRMASAQTASGWRSLIELGAQVVRGSPSEVIHIPTVAMCGVPQTAEIKLPHSTRGKGQTVTPRGIHKAADQKPDFKI